MAKLGTIWVSRAAGNDANTGRRASQPKATLNAAMALATNRYSPETIVVIPDGEYDQDVGNPPAIGDVAGQHHLIIGDTLGEYEDLDGQKPGVAGHAVFRRRGYTNQSVLWNWSACCSAWDVDSLVLHGSWMDSTFILQNPTAQDCQIRNCIIIGEYIAAVSTYNTLPGVAFRNCAFVSPARNHFRVAANAMPATPNVTLDSCFVWCSGTGTPDINAPVWVWGDNSGNCTYLDLVDCCVATHLRVYNQTTYACTGSSAAYSKLRATRTYFQGMYGCRGNLTASFTDCVENVYYGQNVAGLESRIAFSGEIWLPPAFVHQHSDLLTKLADYGNLGRLGIDGEQLKTAVGGRQQTELQSPNPARTKNGAGVGFFSQGGGGAFPVVNPWLVRG